MALNAHFQVFCIGTSIVSQGKPSQNLRITVVEIMIENYQNYKTHHPRMVICALTLSELAGERLKEVLAWSFF